MTSPTRETSEESVQPASEPPPSGETGHHSMQRLKAPPPLREGVTDERADFEPHDTIPAPPWLEEEGSSPVAAAPPAPAPLAEVKREEPERARDSRP